jgi:hypothetical protein
MPQGEKTMSRRAFQILAIAATATVATISQAAAGGCCAACGPCPTVVVGRFIPVVEVVNVAPIYVVNQGPTYSGPGVMTYPGYFDVPTPPAVYPYVGGGYYYPRYHHVTRSYRTAHRSYRKPLRPWDK